MPLDTTTLKNSLRTLFDDLAGRENDPEQAREDFATGLANAFETFVKSADGKYQPGTLIAGANPVTAVGTNATIKLS